MSRLRTVRSPKFLVRNHAETDTVTTNALEHQTMHQNFGQFAPLKFD
jgi:hypothetical protein